VNTTKIEWTDYSYNPITGCKHGCEYCYACKMARFRKTPDAKAFLPEYHPEKLDDINNMSKGVVFAGSNADFFGEWVPEAWLDAVVEKTRSYWSFVGDKAAIMFLTKNPARYADAIPIINQNKNEMQIWLGTTLDKGYTSKGWDTDEVIGGGSKIEIDGTRKECEITRTVHHDTPSVEARIKAIDELDYQRKWLSIEPYKPEQHGYYMNALVDIDVHWVVIGTMTNPDQKLTSDDIVNVMDLVTMFTKRGIPVFVKNSIIEQYFAKAEFARNYIQEEADAPGLPRDFPAGVALATKDAAWSPKVKKQKKPKEIKPVAKHVSLDDWNREARS
jgi:protein gp37